jgi:hypothetical protein
MPQHIIRVAGLEIAAAYLMKIDQGRHSYRCSLSEI